MKIHKISINHFRGIITAEIFINDYTLLVGENNSGKSTVIDCIRSFYDDIKFAPKSDLPHNEKVNKEPWIEIDFTLTNDELGSFDNSLLINKNHIVIKRNFITEDNTKPKSEISVRKPDGSYDEKSITKKDIKDGKFGKIIFIPAISKVEDQTKTTGPSPLSSLVNKIISDLATSDNAYDHLIKGISNFSKEIISMETESKQSLKSFQNDLNDELSNWGIDFTLNFSVPEPRDIIKSMFSIDIKDKNFEIPHDINYFGSGFQRHFIYTIIYLSAKYSGASATSTNNESLSRFPIILFEEPEAFLHPSQQIELARNLQRMSGSFNYQIICSSHSPIFVSKKTQEISSIVHLRKESGESQAYQIRSDTWEEIIQSNQKINDLVECDENDRKIEMESIKYFLWINPNRAGMFFAKHVLIVEGPSEVAFINKLADDEKITLPPGTYLFDSMGKFNTHRFMNLLSKLGITHSVLIDNDMSKGKHKQINELIESSRHKQFTHRVQYIENNLEQFLSISSPREPRRKPQNLLYHYSTGLIEENKITEFCKKIASCFPSKG